MDSIMDGGGAQSRQCFPRSLPPALVTKGTTPSIRDGKNTLDIDLVQIQDRKSIYASLRWLDQKPRIMLTKYSLVLTEMID
jgi:hypothetical protein